MDNFNAIYDRYELIDKEDLRDESLDAYNFINDLMYKIMDADSVLKNHKDKVDFYLSAKSYECFIAPKKKDDGLDNFIVMTPNIYIDRNIDVKEDHYAAFLSHELGHFFLKLCKEGLVPDDYFLSNGKSFSDQLTKLIHTGIENSKINESLSDIIGMKFLEQAGYAPSAMVDVFKSSYHMTRANDFIQISIDDHPSNQDRIFALRSVLTAMEIKAGKVSDNKKTDIPSKLDFSLATSLLREAAAKRKKEEPETSSKEDKNNKISEGKENPINEEEEKEKWKQFIRENRQERLSSFIQKINDGFSYDDFIEFMSFAKISLSKEEIITVVSKIDNQKLMASSSEQESFKNFKNIIQIKDKNEICKFIENEGGLKKFVNSRTFYIPGIDTFVGQALIDARFYDGLDVYELNQINEGFSKAVYKDVIGPALLVYPQAQLIKAISKEPSYEQRMKAYLGLISFNRIDNSELRKIMFNLMADEYVKKFGLDDGSSEYANNFNGLLDVVGVYTGVSEDREALINQRVELLDIISKKIVSQKDLSFKFRDCLYDIGSSKLDNITKIDTPSMEVLLMIFNRYDNTRSDFVDFLQDDFNVERAKYVKDKICNKIDDVIKGIEQATFLDPRHYWKRDNYLRSIKDLDKVRSLSDDRLQQIHEEFWSRDLDTRATYLAKIMDTEFSNRYGDFSQVFDRCVDNLIPQDVKNRDFMKNVLKEYISAYEDYSRPFLLSAIMSATKKAEKKEFKVGEPLKEFLENLGPAGVKLGQALGSSPDVPEDIREVMQTMKNHADEPTRWFLYDMIDASVPKDKQKNIGKVIGSGSYFVTVDCGDNVLGIVRPNARDRAKAGFDVMLKACSNLSKYKGKDYRVFTTVLKNIIKKANDMADIETDMNVGSVQDKMARQLYEGKKINVGKYSFDIEVAEWKSFGDEYKEVKKIKGIHFNDLQSGQFKTDFAKSYVELELENIFSGAAFDHDRHGAQMKIDFDNKLVGVFDNGAMATWPPSVEEKKQLGRVISNTIFSAISFKKDVGEALAESIEKELKKDTSSDYILSVQRGVLALNDYMREISNDDKMLILKKVLFSEHLDKDIESGFSLKHRMMLKLSDGYTKKLEESKSIETSKPNNVDYKVMKSKINNLKNKENLDQYFEQIESLCRRYSFDTNEERTRKDFSVDKKVER